MPVEWYKWILKKHFLFGALSPAFEYMTDRTCFIPVSDCNNGYAACIAG